jgi:predicted  nucleic acid-binding Zn-ribbon protein
MSTNSKPIPRRFERQLLPLQNELHLKKSDKELLEYQLNKLNIEIDQLEHQIETIQKEIES